MNIKVMARRLRVFRCVKEHMELYGECPTAGMVADALGVSLKAAQSDLARLRRADGLPLPINTHRAGIAASRRDGRSLGGVQRSNEARSAGAWGQEPTHSAPVDMVMSERRHIPAWAMGDDT